MASAIRWWAGKFSLAWQWASRIIFLLGVLGTILSERVALQTAVGVFRLSNVPDMRRLAGSYISSLQLSVQIPLMLFFVFFFLRVLLRRDWMVSLVVILAMGGLVLATNSDPLIPVLFSTIIIALVLFILIRFGIPALMATEGQPRFA